MGKGGRGGSSGGSSGGILGSGIFGLFGTTIRCDSTDTSIYCSIMKIFNLLIVFFVVCYFMYIAYTYYNSMKITRKMGK